MVWDRSVQTPHSFFFLCTIFRYEQIHHRSSKACRDIYRILDMTRAVIRQFDFEQEKKAVNATPAGRDKQKDIVWDVRVFRLTGTLEPCKVDGRNDYIGR